jgi:hypothetical protein
MKMKREEIKNSLAKERWSYHDGERPIDDASSTQLDSKRGHGNQVQNTVSEDRFEFSNAQ